MRCPFRFNSSAKWLTAFRSPLPWRLRPRRCSSHRAASSHSRVRRRGRFPLSGLRPPPYRHTRSGSPLISGESGCRSSSSIPAWMVLRDKRGSLRCRRDASPANGFGLGSRPAPSDPLIHQRSERFIFGADFENGLRAYHKSDYKGNLKIAQLIFRRLLSQRLPCVFPLP